MRTTVSPATVAARTDGRRPSWRATIKQRAARRCLAGQVAIQVGLRAEARPERAADARRPVERHHLGLDPLATAAHLDHQPRTCAATACPP